MATFNPKAFEKKLKDMDLSQTSVQTVSLWIIHHKHHIKEILAVWIEQIKKVKPDKKIILFYLANDVVQNCRKKSKELIVFFGKAFREALPYLNDKKINGQVDRVFKIWEERRVYEKDYLEKFKSLHVSGKKDEKSKHAEKSSKAVEKPAEKTTKSKSSNRPLPPDFKMSAVMNMIVNMKELESEIKKQESQMASLRVDASDLEAVKQVKDRSGVNKFVKEFEESKEKLDVHCNTMSRSINDKRALIDMLYHSESYYDAAYEEAKVIVHAYKTFGSRLSSMKRKVESRVKKLEAAWKKKQKEIEEKKSSQPEYEVEPISDAEEPNEFQPIGDLVKSGLDSLSKRKKASDELYRPEDPTCDNVKVLDMDLESDSDQETPNGPLYDPSSVLYDPSEIADGGGADATQSGNMQITIPNPEDVFKNLVGQSEASAVSANQLPSSTNLTNEIPAGLMTSFPQLSSMATSAGQPNSVVPGNLQFVMTRDLTPNSQQLIQQQTQAVTSTVANSSIIIATEPSGTLLSDAAMSPISEDSCPSPSPEGTPDGLVLEKGTTLSAIQSSQAFMVPTDTFPSVLPTTPVLPTLGSQFQGGEQLVSVAPETWQNVATSQQFQLDHISSLQPGTVTDWSSLTGSLVPPEMATATLPAGALGTATLPAGALGTATLPAGALGTAAIPTGSLGTATLLTGSLPADPLLAGLGMSFPIDSSSIDPSMSSQLLNQSSETMLQPGLPIQGTFLPATQQLLPVVSEASTPTQDESLEKTIRPADILSNLLSKGKQLQDNVSPDDTERERRSHSRSSRKSSSSGKKKSHHRHHSSRRRDSSQERGESSHSSSRSKDRSSRRRSRSRSSGAHVDDSATSSNAKEILKREESISSISNDVFDHPISPKIARLQSISEHDSEDRDYKDESSSFNAAQLHKTLLEAEDSQSRQPTIFDLRRSNTKPAEINEGNQFTRQETPLLKKLNDEQRIDHGKPQDSYNIAANEASSVNASSSGVDLANDSSQAEPLNTQEPTKTSRNSQESPAYFYNARRSPTPEMDRLEQPHLNNSNLRQPPFGQSPLSLPNQLQSSLPIPQFAIEFQQEIDKGTFTAPTGSTQGFQHQNFEHQHLIQPQNVPIPPDQALLTSFQPPLQPAGLVRATIQPESLLPTPERQAFPPEGPPFQTGQQVFIQDRSPINQERITAFEPDLRTSMGNFHADTSFVRPERPFLQPDEPIFRPNRPPLRQERPQFATERPVFSGQRPPIFRHQGPRFHGEVGREVGGQQNGRNALLERKTMLDDFKSQRNSFNEELGDAETHQQLDRHSKMPTPERDSPFPNEAIHQQHLHYDNEIHNDIGDEGTINGIVSPRSNMVQNRPQRPTHFQPRGNMMRPRSEQIRGRFRPHEPNSFPRGIRPRPRTGAPGNFSPRPRFRPPLRPRIPPGFAPRRPVF